MAQNKKISLIVPVYYEEEVLPLAYPRMQAAMEATGYDYEIIFVNDGSRDGTMKELRKIAAEDKKVKVLSFSRNFGHQLAVTAGIGEALITTVFGLCISIVAICMYAYFMRRLKGISLNIEEVGNTLLEAIAKNLDHKHPSQGSARQQEEVP